MSRSVLAFKEISFLLHDLRLHRQLLARELKRLAGERLGNPGELEHDATRLDDGHPVLRGALARAHPSLGGLRGHGLVREDVDPDLAAALDLARHRDPGRLDLPTGDPAGLERLDAVVAELDLGLTTREPAAATTVHAAVLDLLREEHLALPLLARVVG